MVSPKIHRLHAVAVHIEGQGRKTSRWQLMSITDSKSMSSTHQTIVFDFATRGYEQLGTLRYLQWWQ